MTVTDATSLASPGHGVETPAVLDAAHLSRSFGSRLAVDDVSFHVAPGETYGLLGPNGAGKTTTIRLVCGLLSANTGEVTVCGMPVSASTTTAKAQIGYVPQDVSLYPDLTARENLSFFGRLYRLSGAALSKRVDEVLELIDLTDRGNDRVESYSGGMKRRLNIGASLLHRPRPLVLDEPTVGVDPQSRHAILESIRTLGSAGLAVLYTTHYMEEAERLCDRIGIIDHGHLIAEGTIKLSVESAVRAGAPLLDWQAGG
jgi:ABC-2 type transport system ATP-binding protein